MSQNRVEGAFRNATGKIKDAVGGLAGDARAQAEDKLRQAAGKVQSAYAEAADQASDVAADVGRRAKRQPLTALLIAGVVGYTLGRLMYRHWGAGR
ncbi:MAG TPA: CsbD family protein [Steroidobacteraceae bacterium]|jgi:uncharacterized protein YjbJ (UPF0337 family)